MVVGFGLSCPKFLALIKNIAYFMSMGRRDKNGGQMINFWPAASSLKSLT